MFTVYTTFLRVTTFHIYNLIMKSYYSLPTEQLREIGNKVTYYSHFANFKSTCIGLNIIPKGLKTAKEPFIGLRRESFLDKWIDKSKRPKRN